MTVTYALGADPAWREHARYALHALFEWIGVSAVEVVDRSTADVVYGPQDLTAAAPRSIHIRAEPCIDWNARTARVAEIEDARVLYQKVLPARTASRLVVGSDILYSTYALLTGALEQAQPRSRLGVPLFKDSFARNAGLLNVPLVAAYARMLQQRLEQRFENLKLVPRWPNGKTCAVILSHDIDIPFKFVAPHYYVGRALLNVAHTRHRDAIRSLLGFGRAVARKLLGDYPETDRDPNLRVEEWIELERQLGATSCFYVAVTSVADRGAAPEDVAYDFRHFALQKWLRQAVGEGWELGLHASINARTRPDGLRAEKEALEESLSGHRVRGVRHHFWMMDPVLPERTLWQHLAAGFQYDTSLGINDSPGFRRGTAWPFYPFDRERGETVPLLEIPPTLMDGGIFYEDVTLEQGALRLEEHVRHAFDYGGAVVLDWHQETMNPDYLNGAGPALLRVLRKLVGCGEIFWASPGQLAEWWSARRRTLLLR